MARKRQYASTKSFTAAIVMMAMLVWVTVCLPFVHQSKVAARTTLEQRSSESYIGDEDLPFDGSEENSETRTSLLDEYLHSALEVEQPLTVLTYLHVHRLCALYREYHIQLVTPPPKV